MHPGECFGILSPKIPLRGFLSNAQKLEKENICPDHFPDFNFESSIIIIIKNMFTMKNLTDFRKTVETGVDPPLLKVSIYLSIYLSKSHLRMLKN